MNREGMALLDQQFNFSKSTNYEIKTVWLAQSIKYGYFEETKAEIETFLATVGRRKFLKPVYRAMIDAGMKDQAKIWYNEYRGRYHSIVIQTLDGIVRGGSFTIQ